MTIYITYDMHKYINKYFKRNIPTHFTDLGIYKFRISRIFLILFRRSHWNKELSCDDSGDPGCPRKMFWCAARRPRPSQRHPGLPGKRGNDEVIQLIGGNHPLKKGMFPLKHIKTAINRWFSSAMFDLQRVLWICMNTSFMNSLNSECIGIAQYTVCSSFCQHGYKKNNDVYNYFSRLAFSIAMFDWEQVLSIFFRPELASRSSEHLAYVAPLPQKIEV